MQDAVLYSTSKALQTTAARRVTSDSSFMANWKHHKDLRLLDVGTGDGFCLVDIILPLIPGYSSVVAIDLLEEMLQAARDRYGSVPRLTFQLFDIATSDASAVEQMGKFSHVTSFFCFHWIQDQRQLFQNIYTLLQPGGQLFAIFVRDTEFVTVWEEMASNPKWAPFMEDWKKYPSIFAHNKDWERSFRAFVEAAGFKQIEVIISSETFPFLEQKQLKNFLRSISPFIHRLPPALKDEYMDEFMAIFRRQILRLEIVYEQVVLHAVKSVELE